MDRTAALISRFDQDEAACMNWYTTASQELKLAVARRLLKRLENLVRSISPTLIPTSEDELVEYAILHLARFGLARVALNVALRDSEEKGT